MDLFSQLLPLQDLPSVSRVIDQLLDSVRSSKLDKNIGRKGAVLINAAVALVLAFRFATTHHFRQSRETLGNTQVTSVLSPFLKVCLVSDCWNGF
jgi:HEAT repeat-containing protein 5